MKNSQCHKCGGSGTITGSQISKDFFGDSITSSFSPCDCGASLFDKQISSPPVEVGNLDWNIFQYGNNICIGLNAGMWIIKQKNVIVIGDFTLDEGKDIKDGEIIFKEDYFYFKTPLGAILLDYLKNSSDKDIKDVHKFVLAFIEDIKREGIIYNHVPIGHGEPEWAKNQYSTAVGTGELKNLTTENAITGHASGHYISLGYNKPKYVSFFGLKDSEVKDDYLNHNGIVPKSNTSDGGLTPTSEVIDMNFRRLKEIASRKPSTSTSMLLIVILGLVTTITLYIFHLLFNPQSIYSLKFFIWISSLLLITVGSYLVLFKILKSHFR